MSCVTPLCDRGGGQGQEGTDSNTDVEEMPGQDKQMSCEPSLVDKGGQEGTNRRPTLEMEWSPGPDCGDLGQGEEGNLPIEDSLKILDKLESGGRGAWRQPKK